MVYSLIQYSSTARSKVKYLNWVSSIVSCSFHKPERGNLLRVSVCKPQLHVSSFYIYFLSSGYMVHANSTCIGVSCLNI